MLIDVVMRADYVARRGGDVYQIEHCLQRLGDRVDVRYLPLSSAIDLREGAICHIVNIDRPHDFLLAAAQARGPVVVSPIHHSLKDVLAMRASINRGALFSNALRERLTFIRRMTWAGSRNSAIKGALKTFRTAVDLREPWRCVGRILNDVDAVALLSEQERRDIIADTGWSGGNARLIPNGVPPQQSPIPQHWPERACNILVVGRIEPRKRQVEIAQAAKALRIPVTFIGPLSGPRAYEKAFLEAVKDSGSKWLGPLSPQEVFATMGRARVLLNASWVEVQSLVDIEAAIAGCWVITGPSGSSREWLGPLVDRADDADVEKLLVRAQQRALGPPPPSTGDYAVTWEDAAEAIYQMYQNVSERKS